jgi:preprotein translocase subunit YajC
MDFILITAMLSIVIFVVIISFLLMHQEHKHTKDIIEKMKKYSEQINKNKKD